MNWSELTSADDLKKLSTESFQCPVIIFKHSTRCSISRTVLDRLERNWKMNEMPSVKTYFLDLLNHRDVSNAIADTFNVEHESPQLIVLKNGEAAYFKSHFDIDYNQLKTIVLAIESKAVAD